MKVKKSLFFLSCMLVFSCAFSQIEKGRWHIGGSLSMESNLYSITVSNPGTFDYIDFTAGAGYFTDSSLSAGLNLGIFYTEADDRKRRIEYTASPFLRYYKELLTKLYLYGQGAITFTYAHDQEIDYGTQTIYAGGMYFSAGLNYFLSRNIAMELQLGKTGFALATNPYDSANFNFILKLNTFSVGARFFI